MKRTHSFVLITSIFMIINFNTDIFAQEKPIQLALFNPVQIFPENTSIAGLRINLIYGKNASVTGLDWGLVNSTTGIQKGVQFGLVNLTNGGFSGWQDGLVNISKGNSQGLQTGGVNYHEGYFNGLQLSIVNYTETLKGLQLGLINIIGEGGFLPFFPVFNFDFD
jgi:hypothetical protein